MARQRREIVVAFVGKDELSSEIQRLKNELSQVKTAGGGAAEGLERINRTSAAAGTTLRAFATTTRFAATQVLSELNPAVGGAVAQMTSMASVARSAGASISAGLVVGGIAVAITAIGLWIRRTNEQIERQAELNRRMREFDAGAFSGEIRKMSTELDVVQQKLQTTLGRITTIIDQVLGGFGRLEPGEGALTSALIGDPGELERRLDESRRLFDEIRRLQFPGEMAKLQAESSRLREQFFTGAADAPTTGGQIERRRSELHRFADEQLKLAVAQLESERMFALARAETLEEQERIEIAFRDRREQLQGNHNLRLLQADRSADEQRLGLLKQFTSSAAQITRDHLEEETRQWQKLDQTRGQLAQGLLQIREEFGEAGLLGAIQAIGPAFDANLINKINELEDPTMRMLRNYQQSLREMQRAAEEFARSTASFISSTLFDFLEGRVKSFDEFFRRTFINLARVQVERLIFQGLAPRSGGAGGFFSVAAPAAAGVAGIGLSPFAAAQGFTQQQALAELAGFGSGGGGAGPGGTIGNIGTGLAATGQFLNAPLLTFGTDIGAAALGGAEAAFGGVGAGIGVSALGILAAGLGGVGLGATLFPQGGIGPMIGGGIGGIGGFIGGAALGGALGIAATSALAVILPGVGAILGAVAGSFLGSLFGGSDRAQNVARSRRANQIAQGVSGQIEAWARDHPVLGPPLLAVAQYAIGVQTTGRTSSRNQLNVAAGLRQLFSGGSPTDLQILQFLQGFGPATILTRGLGMSPPVGTIEEIRRQERGARLEAFEGDALFELLGEPEGGMSESRILTGVSAASLRAGTTGIRGIQDLRVGRGTIPDELMEALLEKLNEFTTVRRFRLVATELIEA